MNEIAQLDTLKQGDFTDSVQAWLWAISASNGGELLNIVKIQTTKPYVYLELDKKFEEIWNFKECFINYMITLFEGPTTLEEMVTEIVDLGEKSEGNFSELMAF